MLQLRRWAPVVSRAPVTKSRLTHLAAGSRDQNQQRLEQLESLFEAIRLAPLRVVNEIVREIRSAQSSLKKRLVPVGPWEGREGDSTINCNHHDWQQALTQAISTAYEDYGVASRGSSVSVIPIRRRTREYNSTFNFNDPLRNDGEDEDVEADERTSVDSGSDSSGSISIVSMQGPCVDVFVERFVDAFSPEVDVKSGRAGALRAAAEIRMFSPLISDAFEAVSVAFFGRSIQNKQIEASGFRLYPRVLRGLQDALNDPEQCKAESTLVTVILLLAFEVCQPIPNISSRCQLTVVERGTHYAEGSPSSRSRRCAPDRAQRPGEPFVWSRASFVY